MSWLVHCLGSLDRKKNSRPLLSRSANDPERENASVLNKKIKIKFGEQLYLADIFCNNVCLPDLFAAGGISSAHRVAALFTNNAASGSSSPSQVPRPFSSPRRRGVSCMQVELWKLARERERRGDLKYSVQRFLGRGCTGEGE